MKQFLCIVALVSHALSTRAQPLVREPISVPGNVLGGSDTDSCPSQQATSAARNELHRNISAILANLQTSNLSSCGGTPGWRRVGYLDMTDPSESCPPGLALKYYSPGLRSCGRATNYSADCWSTFYTTGTSQYSRVCGRVRGYQFGNTGAFLSSGAGIDSFYVDGVSLTHGQSGSRVHIWTFAGGLSQVYNGRFGTEFCTCTTTAARQPPAFVGNDYFCESGFNASWDNSLRIFYPADPLWDGQNCIDSCCQLNNPPYFTKTLPAPTTDDIELRICSDDSGTETDIPIDQVELFVQ